MMVITTHSTWPCHLLDRENYKEPGATLRLGEGVNLGGKNTVIIFFYSDQSMVNMSILSFQIGLFPKESLETCQGILD